MRTLALTLTLLTAGVLCAPHGASIPMESTDNTPQRRDETRQAGPRAPQQQDVEAKRAESREFIARQREAYARKLQEDGQTTPTLHRTTRPALAVGTLTEINQASGTITLAVDPERSALPRALRAQLRDRAKVEAVQAEQFTPQRTFKLGTTTLYIDGRTTGVRQMPAKDGLIPKDPSLIKLSDFKVGEAVSVMFRLTPLDDAQELASAINLTKVPPQRKRFSADLEPTQGVRLLSHDISTGTLTTSPTLVGDHGTSTTSTTLLEQARANRRATLPIFQHPTTGTLTTPGGLPVPLTQPAPGGDAISGTTP